MNYLIKILNASVYDVAIKTPLDEATELSKKYGEESSKNFVNGILASVVKEEIGEN